ASPDSALGRSVRSPLIARNLLSSSKLLRTRHPVHLSVAEIRLVPGLTRATPVQARQRSFTAAGEGASPCRCSGNGHLPEGEFRDRALSSFGDANHLAASSRGTLQCACGRRA